MGTIKHKGNGKLYAKKIIHPHTVSIKQNSDCEWEDGFAYFDPMKPNHLYITGRDRISNRFECVKSEYNGDELYDDIFEKVYAHVEYIKEHSTLKLSATDLTNEIIKRIQPKIEVLNNK